MADVAYAFKWDEDTLLNMFWDELLAWHGEVARIYRQMGMSDDRP